MKSHARTYLPLAVAAGIWSAAYAPPAYAAEGAPAPSAVSAQTVKLPDGPGSVAGLGGDATVEGFSGQVSYSVGIDVPTLGTKLAPSLGLTYSGDLGNGPVGIGWTLGVGSIRRSTRLGVPTYTSADELEIAGVASGRLVRLPDGSYRVEGAGNSIHVAFAGNQFKVTAADGTQYWFGSTAQARLLGTGGHVAAWYLDAVEDVTGQRMTYVYEQHRGQVYLAGILYGPGDRYRVRLDYEDRHDKVVSYRTGARVETARRLSAIHVESKGSGSTFAILRSYHLRYDRYDDLLATSRLDSVRMTGYEGRDALPELSFEYGGVQPPALTRLDTGGWTLGTRGVALYDVDGDGMDDLVRLEMGNHAYRKNWGDQFGDQAALAGANAIELEESRFLDLNGDARPELVRVVDDTWRAYELRGTQWEPVGEWGNTRNIALFDVGTELTDLNGDGRMDVVIGNGTGLLIRFGGDTGLGATLTRPPIEAGAPWLEPGNDGVRFRDVNGDGLADVVYLTDEWMKIYLGRGDGTFVAETVAFYPWGTSAFPARDLRLGDLNRDGLLDLVRITAGHVLWYRGTADGRWSVSPRHLERPEGSPYDAVVELADVNGNGSLEVVWSSPEGMWALDLAGATSAGMLTAIHNGLGKESRIYYTPSALLSVQAERAGRPWTRKLPISVPIPSHFEMTPSPGETPRAAFHTVRDGFWDGVERRFGGFLVVEQRNNGATDAETRVEITRFHEGLGDQRLLRGVAYYSDLTTAGGELFAITHTTSEARRVAGLPDHPLLRRVVTTEVRTESYEGVDDPIVTLTQLSYDPEARPVRETSFGRLDLDGDEVITERRYCDDASRWIRDVVVEQWAREGDGTLAAWTRTYYGDDSDTEPTFCQGELGELSTGDLGFGWPRRVDSYLAQPDQLDRGEFITAQRVRYNGQGNPIWTQQGRVERVLGYDTSGLFAVSETVEPEPGRELTWSVTSYDFVRGLVREVADPNGVRSGAHYDDLGRVVAMRVNDYEPHVRYEYNWEGARPHTITYAWDGLLEDTPAAVAWSPEGQWRETIAVANGAGEGLFSAVRLGASEWLVSGWEMRDHKGRVNEVANPFSFAGSDPVAASLPDGWPRQTLTYDVLDRVTTQTLPTGAEKHVIYKAFEATAERADMDPVTSRLDGQGRVVYTERVVDGVVESVEAEYNALGAIERMVLLPGQQQEVVRTFGYDTQGNLLYSWDPDIGPRFYNWGTDGLLNYIDNGEGERTEFVYDQVGRLTLRRGSDGAEYRYHYDIRRTVDTPDPALRNALSRLSWVEEPGGLVELGYDDLGRQTVVRRTIHDRTATETIEQTALGSVLRVTHDADFAYRIDYDAAGRPRVITSEPIDENAGYGELWRAEEIDEAGNIVRARYGNGVVQEGDYDNPLKLVGRVQILAPGGTPYYDARIDRSPFGILQGVVDQDGGAGLEHSATFTYDGGLRLTAATLGNDGNEATPAWQYTFSYKYDGLQNMTERRATGPKELGMLTGIYRYEEEHCLGKRQLGSVLLDDGDTVQFFYDRAGRQVRAGDIEYVYNDLDQLIRVEGLDPLSVSGGVVEHGYGFDGLRTWTRGLDGTTQYWFTEAVTEHDGVRDHYVMFGGNVIAKVTQREVDDGTGGGGTAGGISVIDAGRATARGLALAVMALALALLAMTWRRSARSPWLARTAGVALCAMLAPACGVPPNSAARDLTWSQDDIVYFHYGAAPGPVIMTDANGMVFAERRYEPFGEPIDSFHHDPDGLGLVGDVDFKREPYNALNKQTDPDTQLSYHGARWMATQTARWLTPDPPVKAPDPRFMTEPWGLHPYQYVNQNPVLFWDPDGRDKKDKLAVSVGKNYGCFIGGSSCSRMYDRSVNGVEAPWADADVHEAVEFGSDVGMGFTKQAGRAVVGTAKAIYNYEETAESLWHAVTHPVETWDAITDHYADQLVRILDEGDGEALGEVGFDVWTIFRPRKLASKNTRVPSPPRVKTFKVAQILKKPQAIWGKSASEIAYSFIDEGYDVTVAMSQKKGTSMRAVIIKVEGHPQITQIQLHPGGGKHKGAYYKISTNKGKIKVVDKKTYRGDPNEKARIIYK